MPFFRQAQKPVFTNLWSQSGAPQPHAEEWDDLGWEHDQPKPIAQESAPAQEETVLSLSHMIQELQDCLTLAKGTLDPIMHLKKQFDMDMAREHAKTLAYEEKIAALYEVQLKLMQDKEDLEMLIRSLMSQLTKGD